MTLMFPLGVAGREVRRKNRGRSRRRGGSKTTQGPRTMGPSAGGGVGDPPGTAGVRQDGTGPGGDASGTRPSPTQGSGGGTGVWVSPVVNGSWSWEDPTPVRVDPSACRSDVSPCVHFGGRSVAVAYDVTPTFQRGRAMSAGKWSVDDSRRR